MTEETGFPDEGNTMTETPEPPAAAPEGKPGFKFWKVILTHPVHHDKIVFRSISEPRARAWMEAHFPRGSEAYLLAPDGHTESYEHERQGDKGMHAERWAAFDPSEWLPPDQAPPPGESEWADKEG